MKNLWLYTEERPRDDVIDQIVDKFADDRKLKVSRKGKLKIIPIIEENKFKFVYKIQGVKCENVKDIFIVTVSGHSSFVDYLIFYQEKEPRQTDTPIYLIEETKTDDKESRNTGVYQRSSKFVYANHYYPKVPKIMLYNLKISQKEKPSATYVFGTKMLLTLDIQILGKNLESKLYKKFKNIDELIKEKNSMNNPHYGIPVKITKLGNTIKMSAKLVKAERLSHDPNIGMISIISACLRKLGWKGKIVVTEHGLPNQRSVGKSNKFIFVSNLLDIELDKLKVPKTNLPEDYWKLERGQEKLGTIFTSILCEEFSDGVSVYENHGGCERGYFIDINNNPIVIPKYSDRKKYKDGNKSYIIYIPDIVIYDKKRNIVVNGEGKTFKNNSDSKK